LDANNGKNMIEIRNLVKEFDHKKALNSISLEVKEGDAFGFIGPNGAGKTTTIKILSTILQPTDGEAYLNGLSVVDHPEEVRGLIGYMPDYFGVYDGLQIWEYLDFFAASYREPPSTRAKIIDDVLELTDLKDMKNTYIESLSRGMKQRLGVAKTLLHDPKILILDEPATGLDPRARIELKELLKELTRMKKTIFISSHILPELSDICNKIGIIEAGKLLACGYMEDFVEALQSEALRVISIRTLSDPKKLEEALSGYPGVLNFTRENRSLSIEFSGGNEDVSQLLKYLVENDLKVVEFHQKSTNLEDVFLKVTRGEVV